MSQTVMVSLITIQKGTETVLLHADYQAMEQLKLTGYGYLIGTSSNTYGLMASGKAGIINYIAEAATQQDATMDNMKRWGNLL